MSISKRIALNQKDGALGDFGAPRFAFDQTGTRFAGLYIRAQKSESAPILLRRPHTTFDTTNLGAGCGAPRRNSAMPDSIVRGNDCLSKRSPWQADVGTSLEPLAQTFQTEWRGVRKINKLFQAVD
jgi:hypothetical protein